MIIICTEAWLEEAFPGREAYLRCSVDAGLAGLASKRAKAITAYPAACRVPKLCKDCIQPTACWLIKGHEGGAAIYGPYRHSATMYIMNKYHSWPYCCTSWQRSAGLLTLQITLQLLHLGKIQVLQAAAISVILPLSDQLFYSC